MPKQKSTKPGFGTCKKCGAWISWLLSTSGKTPVNISSLTAEDKSNLNNRQPVWYKPEKGHVAHTKTCFTGEAKAQPDMSRVYRGDEN